MDGWLSVRGCVRVSCSDAKTHPKLSAGNVAMSYQPTNAEQLRSRFQVLNHENRLQLEPCIVTAAHAVDVAAGSDSRAVSVL